MMACTACSRPPCYWRDGMTSNVEGFSVPWGRDLDAVLSADLVDALALEHDHGVLVRGRAGAVDHAGRGDVFDRARI